MHSSGETTSRTDVCVERPQTRVAVVMTSGALMAHLYKAILARAGCHSVVVGYGDAIPRRLEAQAVTFAIIDLDDVGKVEDPTASLLLDYNATTGLPVLLVTNQRDAFLSMELSESHSVIVVEKPFNASDLTTIVRRELARGMAVTLSCAVSETP